MESFSDYSNRLPRGRSYVRNGSVCHLEIDRGEIRAMVSGSSLYRVCITINPLGKTKWDALRSACSGRIASLIDLLRGKIDRTVMEIVTDRKNGLFPLPGEMRFNCDCPDWADSASMLRQRFMEWAPKGWTNRRRSCSRFAV